MNGPFIPPRTLEKLASLHPEGTRHRAKLEIALPLIGNGITPETVASLLREKFPAASEHEIRSVIDWCIARNPTPSGFGQSATLPRRAAPKAVEAITAEHAIENAEKYLDDFRCDEADLWHVSPWVPLEDWRLDSLMMICAAYGKTEQINIVTGYTTVEKDGVTKANPMGAGLTMLRDDWLRHIREHGTPHSEAGAWVRMNPVLPAGSGAKGAICDADVTAHRFALLESDMLPMELALSLYARLPLPVFAILSSGGRGPHAWAKLDCADEETYRADVTKLFRLLARFGIDPSNRNPSRLSRLPGAQRNIGASGEGEQRLYYLNDNPAPAAIFPKGAHNG